MYIIVKKIKLKKTNREIKKERKIEGKKMKTMFGRFVTT
jgi:hypothetical protein